MVGLLVKLFGDHNAIFAELMREFGKTGRFNYHHAPGIVITAFVSLIAGASLGPEAPLADACGGMGTLMADRLKLDQRETRDDGLFRRQQHARRLHHLALQRGAVGPGIGARRPGGMATYFWVLFPSLLASAVATVVFVLLSGTFFETLYKFPAYAPRLVDLLYAAPLGLIGGAVGLLFMLSLRRLQRFFQPMKTHVVLRGLLGGLGMGLIGALLPLTLFSGESGTTDLITHAAEIGVVMLIVLGVAKLFADLPAPGHRLERRLHLPHHVRQRRPGPGGEPVAARYPGCGRGRGDDGGRARRGFEGAAVRGALYDGPGAKGNRAGDCRRRGGRCLADGAAGVARAARRARIRRNPSR